MTGGEEFSLGGLAALGAIGSVCAVLLRSTHQNLKTLDSLRREADTAAENLRRELRDHDETIFELQAMCADYRFAIAKLEQDNQLLRNAFMGASSPQIQPLGESGPKTSRLQDPTDDQTD